jgi:hypothetical protein
VPIDYRSDDFVARIRELTGDGVDIVFDVIGGGWQLWRSFRALRKGGRLIMLGMASAVKGGIKKIPGSMLVVGLVKILPNGKTAPMGPGMESYPKEHSSRTVQRPSRRELQRPLHGPGTRASYRAPRKAASAPDPESCERPADSYHPLPARPASLKENDGAETRVAQLVKSLPRGSVSDVHIRVRPRVTRSLQELEHARMDCSMDAIAAPLLEREGIVKQGFG